MQVRQDFTGIPIHVNTNPDPVGQPITPVCLANCGMLPPDALPGPDSGPKPVLASETPKGPAKISRIDPGHIIRRVDPPYPPLARATRIQGPVTLHAVISRDGVIENLQLVSGHPLLVRAALDAVSQWRFRPYVLNGQPIEVETEITINIILER
jgi:protein TonB